MRVSFAMILASVASTLPSLLNAQQPVSANPAERIRLAAADSAYNDGDRALAQRYYASVLQVNPRNSRAVYQLGQLATKSDAAQAVSFFRQYVALEPRDPWGHIALGQALGRADRLDEGLVEFDNAQRLAPAERDVWIGRARMLAQANRIDDAIAVYERWTASHGEDAEAWRELSALRSKAGRITGAIDALRKAEARQATKAGANPLRTLHALAAFWTEPIAEGSRDSDGNVRARGGLTIGGTVGDALGIDGHGAVTNVGASAVSSTAYEAAFGARWRPSAALRTEAHAGLSLSDSVIAGGERLQPIGDFRLDWRDPGGMAVLNLRANRTPIAASPLLVRNGVVRDEVSGRIDVTLFGPVRIRALARDGYITSAFDQNNRIALGGSIVLAGGIGELSATVQQITFARQSSAGYFSPRSARLGEVGSYAELESDRGVRLAFDVGGGVQQVTEWGLPAGPWGAAYHSWAELALPVAAGSELRFDVESYDSRIGSEVATSSTWQYLSLSVGLHWAVP